MDVTRPVEREQGLCGHCGHWVLIRIDGTLRQHRADRRPYVTAGCAGSCTEPVERRVGEWRPTVG